MRLAVLGSGGIGGYYGALLAKGGHDVVLIARGAHLEALQQRGLTVRTPEGESTIPVSAVGDTKSLDPVDLVLFCVKSYDTEPAAQALAPLMARDTAVITLQNGVDNVEAIGSTLLRSFRTWPGAVLRIAGRGAAAVAPARKPAAAGDRRRRWLAGAALGRRCLLRLRGAGHGARRVRADHRRGRRDRCLVRPDRLATAARSRT